MQKYRIGIIGTENSHANTFTEFFNKGDENGNILYPDCHVTLVYGDYPEENNKLVTQFGADAVAKNVDEMKENVDAVIITNRDGKFHYKYALPFIEAGIPAFIDKPFTDNPESAVKLINAAKKKKVPVCGGSMLKYDDDINELKKIVSEMGDAALGGTIEAPLDINSIYGGFKFYCSHLIEMTLEIFGYDPKYVTAYRKKDSVYAIVEYDSFAVTNHFNNGAWNYSAVVFGEKDELHYRKIDLSDCAKKECDDFVNMLRTGEMTYTYEQCVLPVLYMNAVEESLKTGKRTEIARI
ncbi:MAG: Gfo/Idh/MocA family protein [Monoglobaceae bacterium]